MFINVNIRKPGERKEKILKPSIYFLLYIPFPVLSLHLWGETQKLVGRLRIGNSILARNSRHQNDSSCKQEVPGAPTG